MLKNTILAVAALVLTLLLAEGLLRAFGYEPWIDPRPPDEPRWRAKRSMGQLDPELGWAYLPGSYEIPGFSPEVDSISMTILPDGSRWTGADGNSRAAHQLVFVGGSYTFGAAISDPETFTWKLQSRFPDRQVRNFGVGAYGTYQSLLLLERILPETDGPVTVFYGYFGHHHLRNVLHPSWADMLTGPGILPPYVIMSDQGELLPRPATSTTPIPLRSSSALVNLAVNAWIRSTGGDREQQSGAVMRRLVSDMQKRVSAENGRFVVLLLQDSPARLSGFVDFLKSAAIEYVDCTQESMGPDHMVKGDGHPNGVLNSIWADCIADFLGAGPITEPG